METHKQIRTMPNKTLIYFANRFRKEREAPNKYGKGGTSRWVTSTEFWGREGKKQIMEELKRRREEGKVKSTAGVSKRRTSTSSFGFKPIRMNFRF